MADELVLVALDPTDLEAQKHVLDAARAEAKSRNARISVVLVIETVPASHSARLDRVAGRLAHEATQELAPILGGMVGEVDVDTHIVHGSAVDEVLKTADRLQATVIVMGERRRKIVHKIFGSVAKSVKDKARQQVILVEPVIPA